MELPGGLRVGKIGEVRNRRRATARLARRQGGCLGGRRRRGQIQWLIRIGLLYKVQSSSSHVTNIDEPCVPNLPLHIGAPLLDESVLEVKLERADAGVACAPDVGEGVLNDRSAARIKCARLEQGQRLPDVALLEVDEGGVGGFLEIDVPKGLVKKDSIAAAQNGFGIFEWLPGNTDARLKILSIGILQRAVARRATQVEGLLGARLRRAGLQDRFDIGRCRD